MPRKLQILAVPLVVPIAMWAMAWASNSHDHDQAELLKARENVWRTFFEGDTKTLEHLVPSDAIVMSGEDGKWRYQDDILRSSAKFHADGGKLLRLEFPRTEVQWYGEVAIIWSSYSLETEVDGKRTPEDGRVTEIFVRRNGLWTNPGWHTDPAK